MRRLPRAVVVGVLVASVVVSTAAALRFTDESYLTPEGVVGAPYTHRFVAPLAGASGAGCDPPYIFHVDSGGLPPGLSLDSRSGLVSGTPAQAGKWSFWVSMKDDPADKPWCLPMSAEREFSITIIQKLTIGPETAGPGTVGAPYSLPMTANLSEPKTWSISQGALPPGLNLEPDGVIAGTPTAAGSYPFTVLAVVDPKRSDTKVLTIVVRDPLVLAAGEPFGPTHLARSEVGVRFTAELTASGGSGTNTWSITGGVLPPGFSLSPTGIIAGTPTTAGSYRFTVSIADSEGRRASYDAIASVAERITIASRLLRPGNVGRPYRAKLIARFGVDPKTWRIKRGPLPRGIRFAPARGVLAGIPRRAGTYRIAVEVVDALGAKSATTLGLLVRPA